ncbi:MAG: hypothetical protein H6R17_3004 [Proteobacteria bacterium]|nr:hypothetical protein [Pseudomonadota bacterium]
MKDVNHNGHSEHNVTYEKFKLLGFFVVTVVSLWSEQ